MSEYIVLISCSNSKSELDYGIDYYNKTNPKFIDKTSKSQKDIFERRKAVFNLIKNGTLVDALRQQGRRATHAMNRNLVLGPDLGGEDANGTYLMAKDRYEGQFYYPVANYWDKILSNDHHILIISGLYGILLPTDPIQRYSCHLTDSSSMLISHWKRSISLSIVDFINTHNFTNETKINYIIDLLSEYDYQLAIDWEILKNLPLIQYHRIFNNIAEPNEILTVMGSFFAKYFSEKVKIELPIDEFLSDRLEIIGGTSKIGFESDIGRLKKGKREERFINEIINISEKRREFSYWVKFAYPNLKFSKRALDNLSDIWDVPAIIPSLPDAFAILNKINENELQSRESLPNRSITYFTEKLKYTKKSIWEFRFSADGRIFFGKSKKRIWNIDTILLKRKLPSGVKYDNYLTQNLCKNNDDLF